MRRRMAREGVIVVAVDSSLKPHLELLGMPLDEDEDDFIAEASADIVKALRGLKGAARKDRKSLTEDVRLATRRTATRWSGKRPQVKVILMGG